MATTIRTLALTFCTEQHDRGLWSDQTTLTHRYRLLSFADTVNHLPADRLTRRHAERWLTRPGLAIATRRGMLATLRRYATWLHDNGHCPRNITTGITAPRLPRYAPRCLNTDEVAALIHTSPDTRTTLVVLLAVQEGLRRGEIAALEVGDVDLVERTVAVRGKGGRGGITRVLPLSDQTCIAVRRYIDETGGCGGPLIRNLRSPERGVSPQAITRLVASVMVDAGVKRGPRDGRSAHALRHTAAEHVFRAGADVRDVQHMLGHSSIQSTAVYLRNRPDALRDVMAGRRYG